MSIQHKILIVDDDPDFVNSVQTILETKSSSMVIFKASNKTEAGTKVRSKRPNLVLLGTIMPRGSAFALHKELKEDPKYVHIPILVIDAPPKSHARKGWRKEEGLRLEAEDYISRPVEPDLLLK